MHMKDADPFFRVANYVTLLLSKLMSLMCFGISFHKVNDLGFCEGHAVCLNVMVSELFS